MQWICSRCCAQRSMRPSCVLHGNVLNWQLCSMNHACMSVFAPAYEHGFHWPGDVHITSERQQYGRIQSVHTTLHHFSFLCTCFESPLQRVGCKCCPAVQGMLMPGQMQYGMPIHPGMYPAMHAHRPGTHMDGMNHMHMMPHAAFPMYGGLAQQHISAPMSVPRPPQGPMERGGRSGGSRGSHRGYSGNGAAR